MDQAQTTLLAVVAFFIVLDAVKVVYKKLRQPALDQAI